MKTDSSFPLLFHTVSAFSKIDRIFCILRDLHCSTSLDGVYIDHLSSQVGDLIWRLKLVFPGLVIKGGLMT